MMEEKKERVSDTKRMRKIDIEIKEIPETIWQNFGFCQDKDFKNEIIYFARNISPNKVYLVLGPSGVGKGKFVKLSAKFIADRETDIKEMLITEFYDNIELRKKLNPQKILEKIKRESYSYVYAYHPRLIDKLTDFWEKHYAFVINELSETFFCSYSDLWKWLLKNLAPKLDEHFIKKENKTKENSDELNFKFKHINVAQIPKELIEVELFGYRKGAFTGAEKDKEGIFSNNDDETVIFIDEISKAPPELQSKILVAIEERKFRKIGDTKDEELRGIVFFAINEPPEKLIEEGKILKDFWYRISINRIDIPSLKDHLEHGDSFNEIMEFVIGEIHTEKKLGQRTFECPLPDCEFRRFETEIIGEEVPAVPVDIKLIPHIKEIYGKKDGKYILKRLEKIAKKGMPGNLRQLYLLTKFIIEDKRKKEIIEKKFYEIEMDIERRTSALQKYHRANKIQDSHFQYYTKLWKDRNGIISHREIIFKTFYKAIEEENFSKGKLMLTALLWNMKEQSKKNVRISKGTKAKYRKIIEEIIKSSREH